MNITSNNGYLGFFMSAIVGVWTMVSFNAYSALTIDTTSLPGGAIGAYGDVVLQASGGTPPYAWEVVQGSMPPGLILQDASNFPPFDNFTNGIISGVVDPSAFVVAPQPADGSNYTFIVQVTDSNFASTNKEFTIVIGEGWNHPEIVAGDFNSTGIGGIFNWSDPSVWVGGIVPSNAPGSVVNLEERLGGDSTNIVDGIFTLGVLRARDFNVVAKTGGGGKLIFDNGTNSAVWNYNSRFIRSVCLRGDAYVDIQLNSDLDFRFGAARQEEATVGRIGRQISGVGHLTLTLSHNDAAANRFLKLGEGVVNTYSGGTTIRHMSQIPYGSKDDTQPAIQLNAMSTSAFGTGSVTLDGSGCTQSINGAPAVGRGMWIKFSTNDVIQHGAILNIISRSKIILELAQSTTNTVYLNTDGLPVSEGVYTGGSFSWLYGKGVLVVLNTNPPSPINIITANSLQPGREDQSYVVALLATNNAGVTNFDWSLIEGALPQNMTLSENGVISGLPTVPTTADFTVRVSDTNGVYVDKQYTLLINSAIPPKVWNVPAIASAQFNTAQTGSFTWSDTNAWASGIVPGDDPGQYVSVEPSLSGNVTINVNGTNTLAGLFARSVEGAITRFTNGTFIFDNGSSPALCLLHRSAIRFCALRPDLLVNLQLISDLEIRMGAARPEEATVGHIGGQISGPGHLTLTLSSHDASATRFHKLGEGVTNSYTGGTTVRHIWKLDSTYAQGDSTMRAVHLNALSTAAFGTGDVTLDGAGCTHNASYQAALGNFGRGMWVRFSASDVIASNAVLNLIASTNITIELSSGTTNTAYVNIDGEPLCPGTYTAGQLPWLYGGGYLVVKGQCNLASSFDGSALTLNWSGNSVLQAAPTATGVYTNIPDAFSPYVITDLTAPQMYYRLVTPQQ